MKVLQRRNDLRSVELRIFLRETLARAGLEGAEEFAAEAEFHACERRGGG
jgi:hypothetical protein